MRIACIDQTAADRVELQKLIDKSLIDARDLLGHLSYLQAYPTTVQNIIEDEDAPDIAIVGPNFNPEDSLVICRRLKDKYKDVPIITFLSQDAFELSLLRRFKQVAEEVLSTEDNSTRIIHSLVSLCNDRQKSSDGKLIVVNGVKGGVGATTVVSGLAHAAQALGQASIVVDLSQSNSFVHYALAPKQTSQEFAEALKSGARATVALAEDAIVTAPNGLDIFLPPKGGNDIRELWIRDQSTFDLTLGLIEILREMYDTIIVDTGRAEGLVPFALNSRADSRLLVTSTSPASVHLLSRSLTQLESLPGNATVHVIVNTLEKSKLSFNDILDFVTTSTEKISTLFSIPPIPHDATGNQWIGTGNSFYTESTRTTQIYLEKAIEGALGILDKSSIQADTKQTCAKAAPKRLISKIKQMCKIPEKTPPPIALIEASNSAESAPQQPSVSPGTSNAPTGTQPEVSASAETSTNKEDNNNANLFQNPLELIQFEETGNDTQH